MTRIQLRKALTVGILMSGFLATSAMAAAPSSAPAEKPRREGREPEPRRDARENVPAALIGPWKVDLDASHYAGNTKPKVSVRTFQYTEDGKLLVTFLTVGANGAYSTAHWAVQVDGTPGNEYHSTAGSIPFNVVSLKKINETTLNLTVSRHGK